MTKKWKLYIDLCSLNHSVQYIYFNVSSVNLKGNKRNLEIQRTSYLCCLKSSRTIAIGSRLEPRNGVLIFSCLLPKLRICDDEMHVLFTQLIFHVRFFLLKYNIWLLVCKSNIFSFRSFLRFWNLVIHVWQWISFYSFPSLNNVDCLWATYEFFTRHSSHVSGACQKPVTLSGMYNY